MTTAFRRFFFWLSGAGTHGLENCPDWEQRKYVAFGATVLVPCSFAFIACAYALSTLTTDFRVIFAVSLVWAFIILAIDRALLASYRPTLSFVRKISQFSLRFVIAFLLGLTISHPLTLLLFRDTITAEVEKNRQAEINTARSEIDGQKKQAQAEITRVDKEIEVLQGKLNATFDAYLPENWALETKQKTADAAEQEAAKAALERQIEKSKAPYQERITAIEAELQPIQEQFTALQTELDYWQKEYEREINGQRSGFVGIGPRAKSVETDQLMWRRAEVSRLTGIIQQLTAERTRLRAGATSAESGVMQEFGERQAADVAREKAEQERLAALKKQIQEQQAAAMVLQLERTRETLTEQINGKIAESKRLTAELAQVSKQGEQRIAEIQNSKRNDILTQTLALHALFERGGGAGEFAMMAYAILTGLFMLVDTIPLLIKFFTKAGPYDLLTSRDEIRFQQEHDAFVASYGRYSRDLRETNFLTLTQNQPLERALIEGVERSRVAKQFLESLIELEKAFQERMKLEQASLDGNHLAEKRQMLEQMARTFYNDLHARMAEFFDSNKDSKRFMGQLLD